MAKLSDLVEFLDRELQIDEIPDYPGAHNGLQLQNSGDVTRVAAAVDASLPVIEKAIAAGADLLVVHHGMFWQGVRMLTGADYRKIKIAIEANLAIYSAHIPLDIHSEYGNNALLSSELGLEGRRDFFPWKGINLGISGHFEGTLTQLQVLLESSVRGPVQLRGEGDQPAGRVGVITGGAGSEVEMVAKQGIETFITGEGPHWSHPLAEELGLNVLYAGHYATETFGVKRLAYELGSLYRLDQLFIDHPSGR